MVGGFHDNVYAARRCSSVRGRLLGPAQGIIIYSKIVGNHKKQKKEPREMGFNDNCEVERPQILSEIEDVSCL